MKISRILLSFVLLLSIVVIQNNPTIAETNSCEWIMSGYNGSRNPYIKCGPEIAELSQLWYSNNGETNQKTPIIANKKIYSLTHEIGSKQINSVCIDSESGKEVWKTEFPFYCDWFSSGVYFDETTAYIGSSHNETEAQNNVIVGFDSSNGAVSWIYSSEYKFSSDPIIDSNGNLFFNNSEGYIGCLSAKDGTKKWIQDFECSDAPLICTNGFIFFVDTNGFVRSIHADSGKNNWTSKKRVNLEEFGSEITFNDYIIYVGSDKGGLYSLSAEDGSINWTFDTDIGIYKSPTIDDDHVYFYTGCNEKSLNYSMFDIYHLSCLNKDTGKLVWKTESRYPVGSPTVTDNFLYTVSDTTMMVCDKKTGEVYWETDSINPHASNPIVANEKVYTISTKGDIECYEVSSIYPSTVNFGSIELGDNIYEEITFKNDTEKKQSYRLTPDKPWIKLTSTSFTIKPGDKKTIETSISYGSTPNDSNLLAGLITVKTGDIKRNISVRAYINQIDDLEEENFDECEGWNELGYDNNNSNTVPFECSINAPGLEKEWSKDFEITYDWYDDQYKFINHIYCFDNKIILHGFDLHCLNFDDGAHRWKTEDLWLGYLGGIVRSDDKIYFGCMRGIKCLELKTGREVFYKKLTSRFFNTSTFIGNPQLTISSDNIFFSFDNEFYRFNVKTKELSNLFTDRETRYTIWTHPITTKDAVIFDHMDDGYNGYVKSISKSSGIENWNYPFVNYSYMVSNGNYIVLCNKHLIEDDPDSGVSDIHVINIETGNLLWKKRIVGTVGEFSIFGNNLYFGTEDGEIYNIDIIDNEVLWKHRHFEKTYPIYAPPLITKYGLYITARANNEGKTLLYRVDRKTGEKTWEKKILGYSRAEPIITNGRFLIVTQKNKNVDGKHILYKFKGIPYGEPTKIDIPSKSVGVELDDTYQLEPAVIDENGYKIADPIVSFASSNDNICSVDTNGVITAKGTGKCYVYIQHRDAKEVVTVKVVDRISPEFIEKIDFGLLDSEDEPETEIMFKNRSVRPIKVRLECESKWLKLDHDRFSLIRKGSGLLLLKVNKKELTLGATLEAKIIVDWSYGSSEIWVRAQTKGPMVSPNEFDLGELEVGETYDFKDKLSINNTADIWLDITASCDAAWLEIETKEITVQDKSNNEVSFSVNTSGLLYGQKYNGKIILEWRKGGRLVVPVSFTTPPDTVKPKIKDISAEKVIKNAKSFEVTIEVDEPCLIVIGKGVGERTSDKEKYIYKVSVPVEAAPSINEFEVIATDMSDNETRTSISVTNLYELVVTMQIGSNVMTVSGEDKSINPPPTVISGSTMVPVRAVSEAFGAEVEWVASTKSVIITLGDSTIILYVNSEDAMVNNESRKVSPAPQIVSGSTMLPFRFIAEALGAEVGWDGATKTITMTLKMEP